MLVKFMAFGWRSSIGGGGGGGGSFFKVFGRPMLYVRGMPNEQHSSWPDSVGARGILFLLHTMQTCQGSLSYSRTLCLQSYILAHFPVDLTTK